MQSAPRRNRPNMPPVKYLEWDSAFFGIRIGRVIAASATHDELCAQVQDADRQSYDCLYWLIDAGDRDSMRAAEGCGFQLVDVRMTYEWRDHTLAGLPADAEESGAKACVRPIESRDLPRVLALARGSHRDSRFFADGRFDEEKCGRLYEEWVRAGLCSPSKSVLVADRDGEAAGYCVCERNADGSGSIGLLAVDPRYHGQSFGTTLVRAALDGMHGQGAKTITVVTQGCNIRSQRLYQRCGFVTRSAQLWYHRWAS